MKLIKDERTKGDNALPSATWARKWVREQKDIKYAKPRLVESERVDAYTEGNIAAFLNDIGSKVISKG